MSTLTPADLKELSTPASRLEVLFEGRRSEFYLSCSSHKEGQSDFYFSETGPNLCLLLEHAATAKREWLKECGS
jgi:hypothetical protein